MAVKVTNDGGLIIHPDSLNVVGDHFEQATGVSSTNGRGAGFGQAVSDADYAFAACREPVAHFLTYGVAADVTDKWFYVDDLETKNPDIDLNTMVQNELTKLGFQGVLTEALTQARIYGKSLLVCAFDDAKTTADLQKPLRKGAKLLQFETYPKTQDCRKTNDYTVDKKVLDVNSLRFGKPEIYRIDQGDGRILYVHYTRCIEVDNKFSVLAPVFDDITCGRNIRWGAAQWLFRFGGGFPVLSFPEKTNQKTLDAYVSSGAFSDLMNRSYICLIQNSQDKNDGVTLDFKGAAGSALNPIPFFKSNLEQIAIATGIPQAKLVGAQAGAVTGSDVNMQDYFKVISRIQNGEPTRVIHQVIMWLAESGQIARLKVSNNNDNVKSAVRDYRKKTVTNYAIIWNSAFELSEVDKAKVELDRVRANQIKLEYMTIDEVRAEEDLEALPDEQGKKLKGSTLTELFEPPPESKEGTKETPTEQLLQADKFLLIDLKAKPKDLKRHKHET
ncbi:MAG: DUF1073 domain-containing protein [Candidatus Bathyarchaeota archaeon]|nr:DUF1073 domain-containing protein [Candidatus Termiticorpusculum sp.]